jgi:hypothetical protein
VKVTVKIDRGVGKGSHVNVHVGILYVGHAACGAAPTPGPPPAKVVAGVVCVVAVVCGVKVC